MSAERPAHLTYASQIKNLQEHTEYLKYCGLPSVSFLQEWVRVQELLLDFHGTRGKYHKGCRCGMCKEAERLFASGLRRRGLGNSRQRLTKERADFVRSILEDEL